MNRNKKLRNKIVQGTAVSMSLLMAASPVCVQAAESAEISKDETVYVTADAAGENQKITVSNWLKNAGQQAELRDQSNLENIKNVKGDEKYTEKNDQIIWKTEGEDIYYTGQSEEEPPVSVSFTYYLDGKEISPENLKGQSGKLKIRIDYENNTKQKAKINGKEEEIYSPFLMMTGIIMPGDTFSNVMIDNGKVISDGDKNIVIGYGMPGLAKSLGIDSEELTDDLNLPESLEITADVTDFSMGQTYTFASSDIFQDLNMDEIDSTEELEDGIRRSGRRFITISGWNTGTCRWQQ